MSLNPFKSSSSKSASTKSGSKSSSKGNRRRNDREWSEWEWSDLYQKEWRQRLKPDGTNDYDYEYRDYVASTESTPRFPPAVLSGTLPASQNEDLAAETTDNYTLRPEIAEEGVDYRDQMVTPTQPARAPPTTASNPDQSLPSQGQYGPLGVQQGQSGWNRSLDFQRGQPGWSTASSLHGNEPGRDPSVGFQGPFTASSGQAGQYRGTLGQPGYPGYTEPYAYSQYESTRQTAMYQYSQNPYSTQGNQAIVYSSAARQQNLYPSPNSASVRSSFSPASGAASGQSGYNTGNSPANEPGYGVRNSEVADSGSESGEDFEDDDDDDDGDEDEDEDEDVDEGMRARSSSSRSHRNSLAYPPSLSQGPRGEQSYGTEASQDLRRSQGRDGQPSYDTAASYPQGQEQHRQQNSRHQNKKSKRSKGSHEKPSQALNASFKIHESKHFKRGKVFKCLWSEPVGITKKHDSEEPSQPSLEEEIPVDSAGYEDARYKGEKAYSSVRRFVIVKERKGKGHCICVPISTYQFQGTNKSGVKAKDHTIIYTGREPPSPLPGEIQFTRPVRMDPLTPKDKLFPASRLNYSKVYTVEHNIKVCFIGKIHEDSQKTFFTDFKRIDDEDEN